MPTFGLAIIWNAGERTSEASRLVESMQEVFPAQSIEKIAVIGRPSRVALYLRIQFNAYSRAALNQLEAEAAKAGAQMVELLRLPESQREPFIAEFLTAPDGKPAAVADLQAAARAVKAALESTVQAPAVGVGSPSDPSPPSTPGPPRLTRTGVDARQSPRYQVNLEVSFSSADELISEHSANISKGGIFVRTTRRFALNSELGLEIQLPNQQRLRTGARVVWMDERPGHTGVGLVFVGNDKEFSSRLEQYLALLNKTP